jgi:hypothetical protein
MMQAANVKPVTKPELVNKVYSPTLSQRTDEADVKESNVVDLQKHKNFNRYLEAYSDCV